MDINNFYIDCAIVFNNLNLQIPNLKFNSDSCQYLVSIYCPKYGFLYIKGSVDVVFNDLTYMGPLKLCLNLINTVGNTVVFLV